VYCLDSSAALKLVVAEAESEALRAYLSRSGAWAISEMGRVDGVRLAGR
jgi:predicted nucleic acid-binding protein